MTERLLDYDPFTGVRQWFSSSEDGDTWHVRHEQDTQAFTDLNKEQQADGWDKREDMWHAARIPNVIIVEWMVKHGVNLFDPNHKPGVKRLLNDPDYRYLRVNHFIM